MKNWTVTGFGVDADELAPATDNVVAFVKKYLPNEYEKMQEDIKDDGVDLSNTAEYIDACKAWIDCYEDDNCNIGFPALFTAAMLENEEGFDVEYLCGEETYAVMYVNRFPWEMSNRVKKMKLEDMEAVFKKYLDELNL